MHFRWLCGYLFPQSAQLDLARASPLVVTLALGKVDLPGISAWQRLQSGRPAVPARPSGHLAPRRSRIADLTRINRMAGAPSVTWAILESVSITDDSSGKLDLNFQLAAIHVFPRQRYRRAS